MTQKETVKAEVEAQAPAQVEAPVVTVNDLRAARDVIAVASKRGAFTDPREFKAVGDVFEKLSAFVDYIDAEEKKQAEAKADAEEVAESNEDAE